MRVISLERLREFWTRHGDAKAPLRAWYKVACASDWANLKDVRRTYAHVNGVRNTAGETLIVFNIGGSKYRLVAGIRYDFRLINVREVLTHQEYDRGTWKD